MPSQTGVTSVGHVAPPPPLFDPRVGRSTKTRGAQLAAHVQEGIAGEHMFRETEGSVGGIERWIGELGREWVVVGGVR